MAGIIGTAAWTPPEYYKSTIYDKFTQYLEGRINACKGNIEATYGAISPSRRGFCGVVANDFFEWLKGGSSIVKVTEVCVEKGREIVCMLFDKATGIYFKRVCFCQIDKCSDIGRLTACVTQNKTSTVKMCGHYAIILSNTDSLKTSSNDYILDFTYQQMLYDAGIPAPIVPAYYISRLGKVFTERRTPRWETQYKCPSKHIVSTRKAASGGSMRRTRRRRRHQ